MSFHPELKMFMEKPADEPAVEKQDNIRKIVVEDLPIPKGQDNWSPGKKEALARIRQSWVLSKRNQQLAFLGY